MVSLKIFNSQGQEVKTLVNSRVDQGLHSYTWSLGQISAGMFSILLQAENQILSKKMIVTK